MLEIGLRGPVNVLCTAGYQTQVAKQARASLAAKDAELCRARDLLASGEAELEQMLSQMQRLVAAHAVELRAALAGAARMESQSPPSQRQLQQQRSSPCPQVASLPRFPTYLGLPSSSGPGNMLNL